MPRAPERALVRAGFDYGQAVRVIDRSRNDRTALAARYDGLFGTVEEHNDGEIGVRFNGVAQLVWFLPGHLELSL